MLSRLRDDYTPILIEFRDAVMAADGKPLSTPSSTWLEIIPPEQVRKGSIQALPTPIYAQVPADGVLRLKLLNSNIYLEPGRYTINYYRYGFDQTPTFRRPFHTEQWLVPPVPDPVSILLTATEQGDKIDLPIWSLVSSPYPTGEFKVVNSRIVWLGNGPSPGEVYTVVIQPGFGRGDVIWPRPAGTNSYPLYPEVSSYPTGYYA